MYVYTINVEDSQYFIFEFCNYNYIIFFRVSVI